MFLGVTLINETKNPSNCGCAYDGGDCCKKTVAGGTVKTKYWFVAPSILNQQVNKLLIRGALCSEMVLLLLLYAYFPPNSKQCKCLDPAGCTAKCGLADYKGDGNCDDENK